MPPVEGVVEYESVPIVFKLNRDCCGRVGTGRVVEGQGIDKRHGADVGNCTVYGAGGARRAIDDDSDIGAIEGYRSLTDESEVETVAVESETVAGGEDADDAEKGRGRANRRFLEAK
uniref:Uncharacterized protein n=1 Tax=Plectus sambesii TaxID=2011161 RepID=A0A914VIR8_9BILA